LRIILEFARANDAGDPHAFRFAPQSYLVRGERGDFTSAEVAWSRELLADLEALRLPGRDPAALQRVGEVLRRTLEPAGWRQREGAIVDAVAEGRPVSVTVRSAAAELYALPWELLTLRSTGQSLGAISGVLLRYEWPATSTAKVRVAPSERSGRVLIAWSAAGGAVPAGEHVAGIRAAQEEAGRVLDEERDVLEHASFGRLADALSEAERDGCGVDALHILCHGGAVGSTFGLVFDGEEDGDRAVVVDPGRLQQLLAPYAGMLRLVVLAACDSGNAGGPGNRLGSVAQMLHRVGIAAVVASRYPLSIGGSIRLSEVLYREMLARRSTLEQAFVSARGALARDPTTLDWASVQLYARAGDGDATRPLRGGVEGEGDDVEGLASPVGDASTSGALEVTTQADSGGVVKIVGAVFVVLVVVLVVVLASGVLGPNAADERSVTASGGEVAAANDRTNTAEEVSDPREDPLGGTSGGSTGGGSTGGGSTGGGSTVGGSTTASTEPDLGTKKTVEKKKKKKKSEGTEKEPTLKCSKSLVEYIEQKLGSPGGGVYTLRAQVSEGGAVSLVSCRGCTADLKTTARLNIGGVSSDRALTKGGGEVPCTATIEWD